jgi:hypothetical protein
MENELKIRSNAGKTSGFGGILLTQEVKAGDTEWDPDSRPENKNPF